MVLRNTRSPHKAIKAQGSALCFYKKIKRQKKKENRCVVLCCHDACNRQYQTLAIITRDKQQQSTTWQADEEHKHTGARVPYVVSLPLIWPSVAVFAAARDCRILRNYVCCHLRHRSLFFSQKPSIHDANIHIRHIITSLAKTSFPHHISRSKILSIKKKTNMHFLSMGV